MLLDEQYEMCLPILQDPNLEDEDKTDQIEKLFRKETTLTGISLEHTILDIMWRLAVSPLAPPGFLPVTFTRKASTNSPFSSPRASPRLALATPVPIPHSPNLNAYEFAVDCTPAEEILGDYQTENVDWLVNDDTFSLSSSVGTTKSLNAAAPEFSSMASTHNADMSPYDMLRSILGATRSDEEIEASLAAHNYDLSATIATIMETGPDGKMPSASPDEPKNVLVGKSIASEGRPSTPSNHKSGIICKFHMSTGQCLRADCRFSHDLGNHLCKYWVMGNCLAGDTCIFSHDPTKFMKKLSLDGSNGGPPPKIQQSFMLQDMNSFPSLRPGTPEQRTSYLSSSYNGNTPSPGLRPFYGTESPRSRSRPGSRHQVKEPVISAPALDDTEAFPSLGAAIAKQKKHHGKRGGHGHGLGTGPKENGAPASLADIVKMTPSIPISPRSEFRKTSSNGGSSKHGENSATALAIPSPKHIPWLETGDRANKAYLKARQDAIKHGGLRNKFLQSAAQAWNRNDARAAKALSLRGQSENDLMRKAHREAARELYEERNRGLSNSSEVYVDLHGLHPEEAVEYLERVLLENEKSDRPIYAITGTGHHSKNGKDKVGKAIRSFLNEWRYAYREFSVPGDRNNMGGILGVDARSYDKSLGREGAEEDKEPLDILSQGVEIGDGKVRLLVRDPPKGPSGRR
ncbi:Polyadenylate-binding protein-interacting protein 7 [Escovopsis weberi]|uniref:Polyadenylate-binding protein-interacting protein 7 n=1 Tax=Escovopsis weberi TaxID=150374 RepID=A0A0M8N341_ESCWE|nr:Polyadenylate-binding protein-interacting protein 7 [Escovopsis weberi]